MKSKAVQGTCTSRILQLHLRWVYTERDLPRHIVVLKMPPYAELVIDLNTIRNNYLVIKKHVAPAFCAAVLKADAYGMGMEPVARALSDVCQDFFVAYCDEAEALRKILPFPTRIWILNGPYDNGWVRFCRDNKLFPIINSEEHARIWMRDASLEQRAGIHIDTGMNRLGIANYDPGVLALYPWSIVMSHLIDGSHSEQSFEQRDRFLSIQKNHPASTMSLAASSGIFCDSSLHFDLVRPGIALYGLSPLTRKRDALTFALNVSFRILQIERILPGETVGYNATFRTKHPMMIATLAGGYADGIPWRAGLETNKPNVFWIHDQPAPVLGRVSMDLTVVDISHIPQTKVGDSAIFCSKDHPIDLWAENNGLLDYELLLKLGRRLKRSFLT